MMRRREFVAQTAATGLAALGLPALLPGSVASHLHASIDSVPSIPPDEPVELFEMRIGLDLIQLFRNGTPTELLQLIPRLRHRLAGQGIGMPIVRIRDSPCLSGDEYQILIRGRIVGAGRNQSSGAGAKLGYSSQPLRDAVGILTQLEQAVRRNADELSEPNDTSSRDNHTVVVN